LEMEVQSHFMDMLQKEIAIASDREKLLALRHARLTLARETKRISRRISKVEDVIEDVEKDLLKIVALLTPTSVPKGMAGRYWGALAKYVSGSGIKFEATSKYDLFKNTDKTVIVEPITSMIASQFVSHCRFKGYLVRPATKTWDTLFKLINVSRVECNRLIEEAAVKIDLDTATLHTILEGHWTRQRT